MSIIDDEETEVVECFERRDDGYYLVATAKTRGKKVKKEEPATMKYPLPLTVGAQWQVERSKLLTSAITDYSVAAIDSETGVANIKGESKVKILGIKTTVLLDSYIRDTGVIVSSESITTIGEKEIITKLVLVEK